MTTRRGGPALFFGRKSCCCRRRAGLSFFPPLFCRRFIIRQPRSIPKSHRQSATTPRARLLAFVRANMTASIASARRDQRANRPAGQGAARLPFSLSLSLSLSLFFSADRRWRTLHGPMLETPPRNGARASSAEERWAASCVLFSRDFLQRTYVRVRSDREGPGRSGR